MSIPCENPLKLLQLPTPYTFHVICVLQDMVTSSHGQVAFRQPSTFWHVPLHIFQIHFISCYISACQHVGIAISIIHSKLCALDGMSASSYTHINGQSLYMHVITHNKLCVVNGMSASSYNPINGQPLYMQVIMWTRQHVGMSV